jgi:ankyrin repeat protein
MPHKRNVDKFGATRLARESEKGDLPAVRAAYNAAPEELDQEDFAGIAPLQKAALNGNDDVVAFLIKKGCRTDCESNDRDTPLIDAVENGHLETVKLLLNEGHVNPHHQNKKGQRAIDVLDPDDEDHEEIEKVLKESMRRHADTSKTEDSHPVLTQQKSASRLLYNEYNTETLVEKAGDGDIAAVGELINSNIKPNIACGVAASRGGHYDILSILLASGLKADPDPSKHSETPMLVAIGRGHLKIVQLLLEQDVFNPSRRNREGKTYWEISEDRRGPKWEQERDVLKEAYNEYMRTHKSPKRSKKEAPNPSVLRAKRKSSPIRREHSSSPQPESKRSSLSKSSAVPQGPQKSRRLITGKEMANRENKRRRRVVSDESSEDESNDEVKRPRKKAVAKPRSFSDGEEHKTVKKLKARSEDAPKRQSRARSDDSDDDRQPKRNPKIRTKTIRSKPTPTPEVESPDERKPGKKLAKARALEEKIRKRRASDVSIDAAKVKKAPTSSAKSTPAPPEKASTPEIVREQRREEAEKQAAEAKRKAAEAEAKKREEAEAKKREEEEAARKAAEEEARKKAEAEAAAEAKRLAEEAKAARIQEEEEEARRRAEAEAKRQEELAARQVRISKLPRALRRACELGNDRPLHFSGEELGISAVFLPLFYATSKDLQPNEHQNAVSKSYIMSFQAVGILGLPELDIARLEAPYSEWDRVSVTRKQRELLLRQYDVALLAQDFRFPMEGTEDFDYCKIQESIKEARQQFLDMDGLYWIEDTYLYPEIEKIESLTPLLDEIKDVTKRRQVHVLEPEAETTPEKKHRPRKSFMDVVLGQTGFNGIAETVKVNGDG